MESKTMSTMREQMNIVIVGHVDHGKSTVIGRLLADSGSLPDGKLESVRAFCAKNSRPFEYAFLLDALKDEQAQGITIDTARTFFKSAKRDYIIIDAPGHIEFLKNMVTGAARAESALLVIDAKEGIRENSKRHGYLLSMLGIKQITVVVNKMDLVNYSQAVFETIQRDYTDFLKRIEVIPKSFIPIAAFHGENMVKASDKMPWYHGENVLSSLDQFTKTPPKSNLPFRMPIQDVYKFTAKGDDRRIVAGRVESGSLNVGDEVLFLPSNKRSRVTSIEGFHAADRQSIDAGWSTGFTLAEQIYILRGELMVKANELHAEVSKHIRVNLFWMGKKPMEKGKSYSLKLGTAKVSVRLKEIRYVIDAAESLDAQNKESIDRHAVADCILELNKALAFDLIANHEATGRFVIVDQYEIAGGGIIRESLADEQTEIRHEVAQREDKFERSNIIPQKRAERLNQRATLVLVTGEENTDRKGVGKALEERLFEMGRYVYYVGMANLLYSVDADLKDKVANRQEHIRRLGELAYLMLDAGMILIVSARDMEVTDLQMLETIIAPHALVTVCLGGCRLDMAQDSILYCPKGTATNGVVAQVVGKLQERKDILSF